MMEDEMKEGQYKPDGDYVPIGRWGKDHWGTLAYLETRAVDHSGVIKNTNMRTHPRIHRELVGLLANTVNDGSAYATRLKDGEMANHDDWSCLEDMVAAGLMRAYFKTKQHGRMFGGSEARIEFTETGLRIAAELRAHKANGGAFGNFSPTGG